MGDPTTNHRITIKQAGTYRVYFEVGGATGATTITWFAKKNGASTFMSKTVGPGSECYCDFAGTFSVADFLELWVTNGSNRVTALKQVSRRPATVMAVLGVEWIGAVTYTVPATVVDGRHLDRRAVHRRAGIRLGDRVEGARLSYVNPGGITLAASTTAKVPLNTTVNDSYDGMVDLVNSRIVIRQAGTYRVRLYTIGITSFTWTQFVRKNGAGSLMSQANAFGANYELDWAFAFSVGDYIEAWYTNGNGSSIFLTDASVINSPYPDGTVFGLQAEWISP
jgi:hypothetical protein